MKKIIIAILVVTGSILSAQVQLEHKYAFSGSLTEISEGEYKYYVMDVATSQCRIYNEDHSLFKTFELAVPSGFYLYDIKYISRNLFNTDDKIELLYIYSKATTINSFDVTTYGMKIVSEDGTVILSLNDGGYAEILTGSDSPKLLAYQYVWNSTYYDVSTSVYKLGSTLKSTAFLMNPAPKIFPNPVDELLYIDTQEMPQYQSMNATIYDNNGRQILKKNLTANSGLEQINTHSLPSGNYILELTEENGAKHSTTLIKK